MAGGQNTCCLIHALLAMASHVHFFTCFSPVGFVLNFFLVPQCCIYTNENSMGNAVDNGFLVAVGPTEDIREGDGRSWVGHD